MNDSDSDKESVADSTASSKSNKDKGNCKWCNKIYTNKYKHQNICKLNPDNIDGITIKYICKYCHNKVAIKNSKMHKELCGYAMNNSDWCEKYSNDKHANLLPIVSDYNCNMIKDTTRKHTNKKEKETKKDKEINRIDEQKLDRTTEQETENSLIEESIKEYKVPDKVVKFINESDSSENELSISSCDENDDLIKIKDKKSLFDNKIDKVKQDKINAGKRNEIDKTNKNMVTTNYNMVRELINDLIQQSDEKRDAISLLEEESKNKISKIKEETKNKTSILRKEKDIIDKAIKENQAILKSYDKLNKDKDTESELRYLERKEKAYLKYGNNLDKLIEKKENDLYKIPNNLTMKDLYNFPDIVELINKRFEIK